MAEEKTNNTSLFFSEDFDNSKKQSEKDSISLQYQLKNSTLINLISSKYFYFFLGIVSILLIIIGGVILSNVFLSGIPVNYSYNKNKFLNTQEETVYIYEEKIDNAVNPEFSLTPVKQKIHVPNDFVYLLGSNSLLKGSSKIYKIFPQSQQVYFSSGKNIVDFLIYENELMIYVSQNQQFQQLWFRDESYESILLYTTDSNERVLSFVIDFNNLSVFFLSVKDSIITLNRIDRSINHKSVKILGSLSTRSKITEIDNDEVYIIDEEICYKMPLKDLILSEVACEKTKKHLGEKVFKIRPKLRNNYTSNDGSVIQMYNPDIDSYVNLFNAPQGDLYIQQFLNNNKILLLKYKFQFNAYLNRFDPIWQSFVLFDYNAKSLQNLASSLPKSNSVLENIKIFHVVDSLYAIDLNVTDKLYRYDPNNAVSNLSLPSTSLSQSQHTNSHWLEIDFINAENYEKLTVFDPVKIFI